MYISPFAALQLTPVAVRRRISQGKVVIKLDTQDKMAEDTKRGIGRCRSIYLRVAFENDKSSHLYHSSVIRIYGSSKDPKQYLMRPDSRLWVHCRCPYFLYYCEQALAQIKASSVFPDGCDPGKRGKGKLRDSQGRPILRNPNLTPYLCKHLYAAIVSILRTEQRQKAFKPFVNPKSDYKGNYDVRMPPSYSK